MKWFELSDDANDIFFPELQISEVKTVERTRSYGLKNSDYYWLLYPNMLEYQQALKVTLYCSFYFKKFPFDSHHCDFNFRSIDIFYENLQINSTQISFETQHVAYGEGFILMDGTNLPFDFSLESLESLPFEIRGYSYSSARIRLHLSRNNIGELIGGYYGTTSIFSLLSLVSYGINVDVVSCYLIVLDCTHIHE